VTHEKAATASIRLQRIRLIPYSPAHLLALIEGCEQFEERFGLRAAAGLREFFVSDEVSPDWLARLRKTSTADPWVHGFAVVDLESNSVIGSIGFKGPPDRNGVVEIAYGIARAYQGKGYATEGAAAGVLFAFSNSGVHLVRAHTLPTRNASTRVLSKNGFERVGEVVDPEDGLVWRWERSRESI
jgi:ribosomal-protein-alanine N-acetyltransferase